MSSFASAAIIQINVYHVESVLRKIDKYYFIVQWMNRNCDHDIKQDA